MKFPIPSNTMSKIVGKVSGLSLFYKDGIERIEIWINKKYQNLLPVRNSQRIPISLMFNNDSYGAGLRMTSKCDYIWVCSNLEHNGDKVRLTDVLEEYGIKKNDDLEITVCGYNLIVEQIIPVNPLE